MPSPVGSELLTTTSQFVTVSSTNSTLIIGTSNALANKPLNDTSWFIGRTSELEAKTLLNFEVPFIPLAVLYPDLALRDITATLVVPATPFLFGDTLRNSYDFRVVEVLKPWTRLATKDSLAALESDGALYGRTLGTLRTKSVALPLFTASLRVPFDAATVLRWLRTDTATQKIHGVAIIPESRTRCVRQFAALSDFAYIEVKVRRLTDTVDTKYTIPSGVHASFISDTYPVDAKTLVVQPGVMRRSQIHLKLDTIPPLSFIHRAELRLTWDSIRSSLSNVAMPDRLYLKFPRRTTEGGGLLADDSVQPVIGTRIADTQQYVFSNSDEGGAASLASYIERLLRNPSSAKNLILTVSPDRETRDVISTNNRREQNDIGRLMFFGLNATDPAVRPIFTVTYLPRK